MARIIERSGDRSLSIHQSIARQLGTAILSGEYAPSSAFPGEVNQSAALGVSRTSYREAIRILAAKGLLESRTKAGTRVLPRDRWNLLDAEVLQWMFSGNPNDGFVRDLFELRAIVEPAAAGLAAKRRSGKHLAAMQSALQVMASSKVAEADWQAADHNFHRAMLQASNNEALACLSGSIAAAVQWTTHYKQRMRALPRDPLPEHVDVFEAIKAGDRLRAQSAVDNLLELAKSDMR